MKIKEISLLEIPTRNKDKNTCLSMSVDNFGKISREVFSKVKTVICQKPLEVINKTSSDLIFTLTKCRFRFLCRHGVILTP